MNVLFVSAFFYPHKGGAELYAEELFSHVVQKHPEVSVDVLTYNTNHAPLYEKHNGITIHRVNCYSLLADQFYIANSFALLGKLFTLKDNHYDVVITQTRFFEPTWWVWIYARIIGAKSIFIEHGTDFVNHSNLFVRLFSKLIDLTLASFSIRRYTKTVVISKATQKFLREKLMVPNTELIYGGIDTEEFTNYNKQALLPNDDDKIEMPIVITFIGRLIVAKGIYEFLEAIEIVVQKNPSKNIQVIIAGTGPEYENMARLIQTKNLNHAVTLMGAVSYEKVIEVLCSSTIFVNPSYNEGLPRTVIEAAAAGNTVIATNVGSTYEILDQYGFIIKPGDVQQIIDAISNVLKDPVSEKKRATEHQRYVVRMFDWETISVQMFNLLREITKNV